MFIHIPAKDLYVSEPDPRYFGNPKNDDPKVNWLKSRFHFSFAEYRDPKNQQFGVLRVMNDDLVQPNRGFGEHPHSNMEIVSYIVQGDLTHGDSKGNKESLGRGSAQYMSAGSGVYHSEFNLSKNEACRFIQIWIMPRHTNTKVQYKSYRGQNGQADNKWFHLVGDLQQNSEAPAKINQDANIWINEFTTEQRFEIKEGRQAYLLCVEGSFELNVDVCLPLQDVKSQLVNQHDGVKVFKSIILKPKGKAHVLLIEMTK
ncbi:unnamed protein product [Paramecium octaurelia]|uniref:Pirin n=1 Tax=Paramecium octaurelia TaxID=43137 RepID=A0A8S1S8P9_PAROT|nr:unnamed protein product [Paramecium octaurelia]